MARVPLEPGRWGGITRQELAPNVWRARATYRDFAGVVHKYEARGASGAEAQRRLEDKLHRAVTDATSDGLMPIAPDTRMNAVFDQWVTEKQAEAQVVPQSMEKYVGVIDRDLRPALGQLRVRE
ncbi:hypothetical protein [Xylanimonas protaetiae]|uniref:Integrase SAM-like N-terminal domain-containing protein n=1 Tax=Xylanimonas protaetiae TaxID=2509457 RepID=A0A4P6F2K4_9MICO|nr:hypothetical protein [Xylanimonas protaetiae]QAY69734.1 hypothetical protein ET471_06500 [Xylanimonas protaetiae]